MDAQQAVTVITTVGLALATAACASSAPTTAAAPSPAPVRATTETPWPAAGALFGVTPDEPDTSAGHFCSASVVDTVAGDVVITAAHCVAPGDGTPPRTGMLFVPGYHAGAEPFGAWTVTSAVVDPEWLDAADPAHDIAFLTVSRTGGPPIEQLTGGYPLVVDPGTTNRVDAVGYPDFADAPTVRSGTARRISPTQLELDAAGLYDGTSGGPWLRDDGQIIGVTGGYEQGGVIPNVSYASYFDAGVTTLLDEAAATPAPATE